MFTRSNHDGGHAARPGARRLLRGGLSAAALIAALLTAAPSHAADDNLAAVAGQADLMADQSGLLLADDVHEWGTRVVLKNRRVADALGVGPDGDMCHFEQVAFRPFNNGGTDSGPFLAKVYRDDELVKTSHLNLAAHDGLPGKGLLKFPLDLAEGWNEIEIDLDPKRVVPESDEMNNIETLRVKLDFPCVDRRPEVDKVVDPSPKTQAEPKEPVEEPTEPAEPAE